MSIETINPKPIFKKKNQTIWRIELSFAFFNSWSSSFLKFGQSCGHKHTQNLTVVESTMAWKPFSKVPPVAPSSVIGFFCCCCCCCCWHDCWTFWAISNYPFLLTPPCKFGLGPEATKDQLKIKMLKHVILSDISFKYVFFVTLEVMPNKIT